VKAENQLKFRVHSALAQRASTARAHNPQAASSRDARLHHSTQPVAS